MKRKLLISGLLFSFCFIGHSQLQKGSFLLDFSGNYVESKNSSGVFMSNYNGNDKTLEISASIGYSLSNSFVFGIGIEYAHIKSLTAYSFYYLDNYGLYEQLEAKTNIVSPMCYFKYYKQIYQKLYVSANLNASYGFVNSDYFSVAMAAANSMTETPYLLSEKTANTYIFSQQQSSDNNILSLALQPELCYFITPKIGLKLIAGGVGYKSYDFDYHEWTVSINPSNWSYGFMLSF